MGAHLVIKTDVQLGGGHRLIKKSTRKVRFELRPHPQCIFLSVATLGVVSGGSDERILNFKELKVIASMPPQSLADDMINWEESRLGSKRAAHSYAWAAF